MSNGRKYIEEFLSRNSGVDLLPFFETLNKRAAKEITESYAMHNAAVQALGISPSEREVIAIVVGDGRLPRTGALLAYLTKWTIVSIDPQMDLEKVASLPKVDRLDCHAKKAEDMRSSIRCAGYRCVLILPHSHADLNAAIAVPKEASRIDLISMPCCVPHNQKFEIFDFVKKHEMITYVDPDVWSPKNRVYIWKNITGGRT